MQPPNGIVAVVGDLPITAYQLRQRLAWEIAIAGTVPPSLSAEQAKRRVLQLLERDVLTRRTAVEKEMSVTSRDVDAWMASLLESYKLDQMEFKKVMARAGVVEATVREIAAVTILSRRLGNGQGERLIISRSNCLRSN